jgi:adenine-specific DNA-methyltransferase
MVASASLGSLKPYYEESGIAIYHGDCRAILPLVPSVGLVLTSPPYNQGKGYEKGVRWADYLREMEEVAGLCAGLLDPSGNLVWQVGSRVVNNEVMPLDMIFAPMFWAQGLTLRNRVVWAIDHGLHCQKRFSGRHETALWFSKGDGYYFDLDAVRVPQKYPNKKHFKGPKKGQVSSNPLGANPGDVWAIPQLRHNHPEKTAHPCQFPELLAERFIRALCPAGGLILDPFAGSGTTLAVALRTGRKAIGIERDEAYCEIAAKRLSAALRVAA